MVLLMLTTILIICVTKEVAWFVVINLIMTLSLLGGGRCRTTLFLGGRDCRWYSISSSRRSRTTSTEPKREPNTGPAIEGGFSLSTLSVLEN